MHTTRLGLEFVTRQKSVDVLQSTLANLVDLRLSAKQAHWTVVGSNFKQLHDLFDGFVPSLDEQIDTIAERIATLGGTPDGRAVSVGQNSQIAAYPLGLDDGQTHLDELGNRFASIGNTVRASIKDTDEAGDVATADILTGTSRVLDNAIWLIEAHLTPAKAA